MTAVGPIRRTQMVDAMVNHFNADVAESFVHNWKRVDTIVADQGDSLIEGITIDFHMIEVCLGGSHAMSGQTETETGDTFTAHTLPGSIGYNQANATTTQEVIGTSKLQQIYIDDLVFRDTAQSVMSGDPDRVSPLAFQGIFDPQLKSLTEKLLEEARCPSIGSDLRADLIIQEIALLILRRRDPAKVKLPKVHRLSQDQLARVIGYFEDEIEDIGGMDKVASLIAMDVYSFTRSFKATTGETPAQFLIKRRLTRAKDLLRLSDDPLADIAYAVGFANQPHMTSTFTKHLGISPGRWRAILRD